MGQRLRARGVKTRQTDPVYEITTKDVEAYLQETFNGYLLAKRNELKARGIKLPYELPKRIDGIQVKSTNVSKKRTIFAVVLPIDTLYSEATKVGAVASIFTQQMENDDDVKLIPEIATFWKMYSFNHFDRENLQSNRYIQQEGLSRRNADMMIHYIEPKIKSYRNRRGDKNEEKVVMFFLDPIRLFYVMVAGEDEKIDMENPQYGIKILDAKKCGDGIHKFSLKRVSNRNRNNKGQKYNLAKDIESIFTR